MPKVSKKARALRELDSSLQQLKPLLHIPKYRAQYDAELARRTEIESKRYYDRPATYKKSHLSSSISGNIDAILHSPEEEFRKSFRMSKQEMEKEIWARFAGASVFQSRGSRKQAKAEYQLALLVYRLAQPGFMTTKDIQQKFGISAGTTNEWTKRALTAVLEQFRSIVSWPSPQERSFICSHSLSSSRIPDCVGYLGGIHMHFHRGGLKPGGPMEYWQESCREGYNFLGVCDDHLRMRMVVSGSTEGRGQDKTMQDGLPWLGGSTEEYFDGKQFVMADKGFKCDNTVLPLYDLDPKQQEIDDPIIQRQRFFNHQAQPLILNTIQTAWGMIKSRWQYLNGAHILIYADEAEKARDMVLAAVVLHNLLIDSVEEYVSREEALKLQVNEKFTERWSALRSI
ncbi:hypothetical protein C362_05947 [Cryptococcus neoformans Bt1]|nr:hypothetical protein C362_05947 [Cryptococcus neoformans var. grubii Bt1]OXG14970.1 hypothetical protein C367_05632 [Cryptococcus neoformans var. grubii Ze90-1]